MTQEVQTFESRLADAGVTRRDFLKFCGTVAAMLGLSELAVPQIAAAIAFLDGCYGIKPSESEFRVALAYNMLVPAPVRLAISGSAPLPRSPPPAPRSAASPGPSD